ncbi:hypothetical protein F0696_14690 [Salmonella enterica]|nr:hypothetical protein [Salmonella enterica]
MFNELDFNKILISSERRIYFNGFEHAFFSYDDVKPIPESFDNMYLITKMNLLRAQAKSNFIYYELYDNNVIHTELFQNNKLNKNDLSIDVFTDKYIKRFLHVIEMSNDFDNNDWEPYIKFLSNMELKKLFYALQYTILSMPVTSHIPQYLVEKYLNKLSEERDMHKNNNIKYLEQYILNLLDLKYICIH